MEGNSGGISVIVLLVLLCGPGAWSRSCSPGGDRWTVGETEECDLPVGQYDLGEVKIDGKVRVTGEGRLVLNVMALYLGSSASLSADGAGFSAGSGPGAGTAEGSGGKDILLVCFYFVCVLSSREFFTHMETSPLPVKGRKF